MRRRKGSRGESLIHLAEVVVCDKREPWRFGRKLLGAREALCFDDARGKISRGLRHAFSIAGANIRLFFRIGSESLVGS